MSVCCTLISLVYRTLLVKIKFIVLLPLLVMYVYSNFWLRRKKCSLSIKFTNAFLFALLLSNLQLKSPTIYISLFVSMSLSPSLNCSQMSSIFNEGLKQQFIKIATSVLIIMTFSDFLINYGLKAGLTAASKPPLGLHLLVFFAFVSF